jgi:hypothetical protein
MLPDKVVRIVEGYEGYSVGCSRSVIVKYREGRARREGARLEAIAPPGIPLFRDQSHG